MRATNGVESVPVKVVHWWPGREYEGPAPIHPRVIAEAKRTKCRFMTVARADIDAGIRIGIGRVCKTDTPNRSVGRQVAVGRLNTLLQKDGWHIEDCKWGKRQ